MRDYFLDGMLNCRIVIVVMISNFNVHLTGARRLPKSSPLHNSFRRITFPTCPSVADQPQPGHLHHRLHHANIPPLTLHTDLISQDPLQLIRLISRHVFGPNPHWILFVVQVVVGGFDLLSGYARLNIMKLVQQRGDLPCLGGDIDVVEAQAEFYFVRKIFAWFVDQGFCHDGSLDVSLENAPPCFL